MSTMENRNTTLQNDLTESTNKVRTLTVQLDESTEELQRARSDLWERESEIKRMDEDIKALLRDLDARTRTFERKEAESLDIIRELRRQFMAVQDELDATLESKDDLQRRLSECELEIERLKQRMRSDQRFKKFVDIKREVNTLKDQNEMLSLKVMEHENHVRMPVMRKSGKIVTKRSRVMSAGAIMTSSLASMSGARLRRPKSSNVRTLVSMQPDSEGDESQTCF